VTCICAQKEWIGEEVAVAYLELLFTCLLGGTQKGQENLQPAGATVGA
jgi:hypothetical protein